MTRRLLLILAVASATFADDDDLKLTFLIFGSPPMFDEFCQEIKEVPAGEGRSGPVEISRQATREPFPGRRVAVAHPFNAADREWIRRNSPVQVVIAESLPSNWMQ